MDDFDEGLVSGFQGEIMDMFVISFLEIERISLRERDLVGNTRFDGDREVLGLANHLSGSGA